MPYGLCLIVKNEKLSACPKIIVMIEIKIIGKLGVWINLMILLKIALLV